VEPIIHDATRSELNLQNAGPTMRAKFEGKNSEIFGQKGRKNSEFGHLFLSAREP
jgi:hypothetical protein